MKKLSTILCLALVAATAACAPAGYYDSNGEYRSYGKSDSFRNGSSNVPGGESSVAPVSRNYDNYDRGEYPADYYAPATTTSVTYGRAGYYDRNGYYIAPEGGPRVSRDYYPPRGMCRVWFPDRNPGYQPPAESCRGIQSRVPAGAYVIYGG